MGLILVKEMPKTKKEYTHDELCVGFDRFNKLSQKLHKLDNLGKKSKPLHWKDEQEAIIMKRDFDIWEITVSSAALTALPLSSKPCHSLYDCMYPMC